MAIAGKRLIDLMSAAPPRLFAPPEDGGRPDLVGKGSRLIMVYSKRGPGKDQRHESTFWIEDSGEPNPMWLGIPDTDSVVELVARRDGGSYHGGSKPVGLWISALRHATRRGRGTRHITDGRGLNVYARFSPDGKQVAYYRHDNGDVKPADRDREVDGTHRRTLLAERHSPRRKWKFPWRSHGPRTVSGWS